MGAVIVIAGMIALLAAVWHLLLRHHFLNSSETGSDKPQIREVDEKLKLEIALASCTFNSNNFDALEWRKPILGKIMEGLADPNTHLIGVCGSQDHIKDTLLQRVYRRVQRDQLFGMVVTATVTKYPDVNKIQEDIACQLGFTLKNKSKYKRANGLIHRIKNEQNVLIVLRNLYKPLDLSKVIIELVLIFCCDETEADNDTTQCRDSGLRIPKPRPLTSLLLHSLTSNSNAFDDVEWRRPALGNVMKALADPNTHLLEVYGSHDEIKGTLLQRVHRRIRRDNLFDKDLTATVTKKPIVRKIQEEIARQLGLTFNHKSKNERAQ